MKLNNNSTFIFLQSFFCIASSNGEEDVPKPVTVFRSSIPENNAQGVEECYAKLLY